MLCSELDNWFVRPPSGERDRVHCSKSHLHITSPGLLQRVDILGDAGGGWGVRGESMQHSAASFQMPVASEQELHLIPLEPLVSRPCNPQHTAHYWTVVMVTAVSSIDLGTGRVPNCYASSRSGSVDCNIG